MSGDRTTIWYFITALSVGGAERTLVDLATHLDRDRFDVTIWTMFASNPLAVDVPVRTLGIQGETGNGEYVERASNPLDYFRILTRFVSELRSEHPDIVQSFLFYDNTVARLAGLGCPNTLIVTGARGLRHNSNPLVRLVDRATIPLSDYIVSNSRSGAAFYVDRGASAESVEVIPNGRYLDEYRDGTAEGLRTDLGISQDAPVVGTVGRLVERKGHRDLLDAWPSIRAAQPEAHCVVVGDGSERAALRRHAVALGCGDSVHFVGVRDDVPAFLDLMDVFVFPSHWEGLPGALQEAMAAGLPIAATDIEGSAELVSDGTSGLLVPVHDPAAISQAVRALLGDPERARSLGDTAQEEAFRRFALDRMVTDFERFYERIT